MKGVSLVDTRNGILTGELKEEIPILEIEGIKLKESIFHLENYYVNKDFFNQYNFSMGAITNEK